jgi:hypothetical protein
MRRHLVVMLRIVSLALMLGGVWLTHILSFGRESKPTVFETVHTHCILIMVSVLYYLMFKLWVAVCRPKQRVPRRFTFVQRDAEGNYLDMNTTAIPDVVRGAPRLTIENVWILVYGVGFILFVTGYCALGLHPMCLACFGVGMGILTVDELVCPRHEMSKVYLSGRVGALLTCLVSITTVSANMLASDVVQFTETLDFYSLGFGVILPHAAHFLMIAVRDNRRFSLGSVVEVCEFGLPFTSFLGLFHLCVAYGQRFQLRSEWTFPLYNEITNTTWVNAAFTSHVRTDGPFLLFFAVVPLLVCPFVVGFVVCVLEGSTIDPLLAVTLILCIHFLSEGPESVLGIYGVVCCVVAVGIRVLCEFTPRLGSAGSPPWHDTQLSQEVVWEREARRVAIANELTRDLGGEDEEPTQAKDGHHPSADSRGSTPAPPSRPGSETCPLHCA